MKKLCRLTLACTIAAHSGFAVPPDASKPKFLFLAGSARKDSVNKKLAHNAYEMAKAEGVDVTFVDLKDYPIPMYDQDLEDAKGLPKNAAALKKIFAAHDGFFIASPEYNGFFTPLLKNTLDWISRPSGKELGPMEAYKNKVIAIGAASPGAGGGRRSLGSLRVLLENLNAKVTSEQIPIAKAYDKFDKDGRLTDAADREQLAKVVEQLIRVTRDGKKG
jgi:chromate reductase, NAD(P)H dehydrogenase (quinone)